MKPRIWPRRIRSCAVSSGAKLVAHYRACAMGDRVLENGALPERPFARHPWLEMNFVGRNWQFPQWIDAETAQKK